LLLKIAKAKDAKNIAPLVLMAFSIFWWASKMAARRA
jgi:hypothetical protein